VSPLDVSRAVAIASTVDLDAWLTEHGTTAQEVVVAIYKKSSGRQTVGLVALQEIALCHGWVDTQTKRIDDERYAIRFVPRRPGSSWSAKNRQMARQLLEQGRVTAAGRATLPADL
jgi:uncharacterized protein YdeI (YjbR/CyaY-like superfamily)